ERGKHQRPVGLRLRTGNHDAALHGPHGVGENAGHQETTDSSFLLTLRVARLASLRAFFAPLRARRDSFSDAAETLSWPLSMVCPARHAMLGRPCVSCAASRAVPSSARWVSSWGRAASFCS